MRAATSQVRIQGCLEINDKTNDKISSVVKDPKLPHVCLQYEKLFFNSFLTVQMVWSLQFDCALRKPLVIVTIIRNMAEKPLPGGSIYMIS